jgi:acyl dehydratase
MSVLRFDRRPSVAAYMARALVPGILRPPPPFPALRARWSGAGPDGARLERFSRLTGLPVNERLPALYPQVFTFPLQMAILTHPSFPLPVWKTLQIRNRLQQHRPIPREAALDVEAAVAGQRVVEKGMEVDVRLAVRVAGELAWESLTSFLYRGRFGEPGAPSPLATAPPPPFEERARWITAAGGGIAFSGISGDHNPVHSWGAYARRLGFRGAFHHPLAVVGQCLARLAEPPAETQRLDLWLKGPVYYGSEVALAARGEVAGVTFALTAEGSERPALLGAWRAAEAGRGLACG